MAKIKAITPRHWRNIIKLSKHKKRSRLERERICDLIYMLDSSIDLTGLSNGEVNSVLHKLRKKDTLRKRTLKFKEEEENG